ncbi:MAG: bifunctional transaldolase/phosoglucose isomerase [Chloroflexota bacterium]
MTILHDLANQGQGIWLDDIRRAYLTGGELAAWVTRGLRGLTSNPTIFEKAITGSADYDDILRDGALSGRSPQEIFLALAVRDITQAADVLRPVYDATGGADGYVSLEVSPALAHHTDETVEEATRLFAAVDRPNLMIKIPATPAGIPAIEAVLGRGINVNVTLIFSLAQYDAVLAAFMAGLEQYAACGGDISRLASVASFFVSRVDTLVDPKLQAIIDEAPGSPRAQAAAGLLGKIAIANARLAYGRFLEVCSGERWQKLAAQGARPQRPLWASTGVKNPAYPDTLYADALVGPHTVNTLPMETLKAVLDHGRVERSVDQGLGEARRQVMRLTELGISLEAVTRRLQEDGVTSFVKSYTALLDSIAARRDELIRSAAGQPAAAAGSEVYHLLPRLGSYAAAVDQALRQVEEQRIIERIWGQDYTVWKPDPGEITNRLGWLHAAEAALPEVARMEALARQAAQEGYTHALLLGMGGSSLAPEVMRKTFGVKAGFLDLAVLDSTDPAAVLDYTRRLDPARTLFIVSTKSGSTTETFAFFRYFYNWISATLGEEQAGQHFVAVTDPHSKLCEVAHHHRFRELFLNNPNLGGRYAALSFYGLAPAALTGLDVGKLLERALAMARRCGPEHPGAGNPAAVLGTALGELAKAGRDKVTLVISPAVCAFGDWAEQLLAASTGKEGRGLLPVVGSAIGSPEVYGDDRCFVYLHLAGDHTYDTNLLALQQAGHPLIEAPLQDLHDLGGQFFLWQLATAIAGQRLGVQPFDQPNVELAKAQARKIVTEYQALGRLNDLQPSLVDDCLLAFSDLPAEDLPGLWAAFLGQLSPDSYLAIQAYLPPAEDTDASLLALRNQLRQVTRRAVTTGYGPRFLHSTGQLHKGGPVNGLFIQITADCPQDVAIPDEAGSLKSSITFGVLELAQALGDRNALLDAGRKVVRFHIRGDIQVGLARLLVSLQ